MRVTTNRDAEDRASLCGEKRIPSMVRPRFSDCGERRDYANNRSAKTNQVWSDSAGNGFFVGRGNALAYAVGLAKHDASALELMTVVTLPSLDAISECALDSVRLSSKEALMRLAEQISGVSVTKRVLEGFQRAAAIVDEGISTFADLIVLGTSSKRGLKKLAMGSTAEEVIRTAKCRY